MKGLQRGILGLVALCVVTLQSMLVASSTIGKQNASSPATQPAADLEAYQVPPDAAARDLPCRPGFPYSRIVGYFTGKHADNLVAKYYY